MLAALYCLSRRCFKQAAHRKIQTSIYKREADWQVKSSWMKQDEQAESKLLWGCWHTEAHFPHFHGRCLSQRPVWPYLHTQMRQKSPRWAQCQDLCLTVSFCWTLDRLDNLGFCSTLSLLNGTEMTLSQFFFSETAQADGKKQPLSRNSIPVSLDNPQTFAVNRFKGTISSKDIKKNV